ncbi:MAG: hypothetical protein FWC15_04575 [Fibromonadales bacterium]|nr:hypothetical protein [Fibromonadales bacterium]
MNLEIFIMHFIQTQQNIGNTIITAKLYSTAFFGSSCTIETIALVIPHPQQSTPKIFLNRQIVPGPSSQAIGTKNKTIGMESRPSSISFCFISYLRIAI